jgi:dienelactone hydrolase
MTERVLVVAVVLAAWVLSPVEAAVVTRDVEYQDGTAVLQGYLAYDDSQMGKRPAVLIVHEWTGIGPYVRHRAEQIAGLGYVAFAVDIYGKGIRPADVNEAAKQATLYRADRPLMRRRAQVGMDEAKKLAFVDGSRIAVMGYCFGGGVALELGRTGADLKGVVSFHGNLDTPHPQDNGAIKAKVLVFQGAEDPFEPLAKCDAFMADLRKTRVDWQVVIYSGAVHGFTNPDNGTDPSKGMAYNKEADLRSWEVMKAFFKEVF